MGREPILPNIQPVTIDTMLNRIPADIKKEKIGLNFVTCGQPFKFTRTANVTVFVRCSFDLLNVTCKQLNRTALNPFLNSTKNGGIEARCKRSLNIVAALTPTLCVIWSLLADAVIFHVLLGVCDLIVKGSSSLNIYRPPMKLRKGNIFTSVRHSVHGGGGGSHVLSGEVGMLDTVGKRAVRILLECFLVQKDVYRVLSLAVDVYHAL